MYPLLACLDHLSSELVRENKAAATTTQIRAELAEVWTFSEALFNCQFDIRLDGVEHGKFNILPALTLQDEAISGIKNFPAG